MKLWKLTTFLTVSVLIFSGCVATSPKPKSIIDDTLPIITLTNHGIVTDMDQVGFEWNSVMKDPRVEGIYVYKKKLDSKEQANKYYDTIKNRFVTHYLDSDVQPNTEYSYVFKTFSKDAESIPSREIIAKTLPPLQSVSWIHVIQEMPRSAKIIWRPHTNQIVEKYLIERKTLADDSWKELTTVEGRLNAEYIDLELKDSHVYKYRIRAITYNDIVSFPSQEVKVLTKALPPSIEAIEATKNLAKKIKVMWKPVKVDDFLHYNVYKANSIDGRYKLLQSVTDNQYIDNIEEDGTDFFYRVSVVDKDGLESIYDKQSAHGQSLVKPSAPSLVGVKMVDKNLVISWNSNDPRVTSFVVEKIKKVSWVQSKSEEFVDIKGKTFIDTKIEPNTTYYYKVYSVDKFSIRSDASMEVKYTTTASQGKVVPKTSPEVLEENKPVVKPMLDMGISEL